jgi:hypothetical protein
MLGFWPAQSVCLQRPRAEMTNLRSQVSWIRQDANTTQFGAIAPLNGVANLGSECQVLTYPAHEDAFYAATGT